jgi:hypothetical protein
VSVRRLNDPAQQPVMADDHHILLFPLADKLPDPSRPRDILRLGRLEDALVLVPLGVLFDLGPVEPLVRESRLGLF